MVTIQESIVREDTEMLRNIDTNIQIPKVQQVYRKGIPMDIIATIAQELGVKNSQIQAAVELLDGGNTIPFIARYRKEVTGSLNDEQLRHLGQRLEYLRNLEEKRQQILETIEEQGKLTAELRAKIEAAEQMVTLEDLYRPYRPKRKTRAGVAKEKGLEPLANLILLQQTGRTLEEDAAAFLSEEKEVLTVEDALQGAQDIIAESISYRRRKTTLPIQCMRCTITIRKVCARPQDTEFLPSTGERRRRFSR